MCGIAGFMTNDGSPVVSRRPAKPADLAIPAHHDYIPNRNRKTPIDFFALRDVGYTILMTAQRLAVNANLPAADRQ